MWKVILILTCANSVHRREISFQIEPIVGILCLISITLGKGFLACDCDRNPSSDCCDWKGRKGDIVEVVENILDDDEGTSDQVDDPLIDERDGDCGTPSMGVDGWKGCI